VSGPAGTCQGVSYDLVGRVRGPRVVLMRSDWNYCTRWHLVCMKSEQALDLHSRWLQKLAVDEARRVRPRPSLWRCAAVAQQQEAACGRGTRL